MPNDLEQGYRHQITTLAERIQELGLLRSLPARMSSLSADQPLVIIPDGDVPEGYTPFVVDFRLTVDGSQGWTLPMTTLDLKTSQSGTPFLSFNRNILDPNNVIFPGSENNITYLPPFTTGVGGESGEGLVLQGDQLPGAGSDLIFMVLYTLVRSSS